MKDQMRNWRKKTVQWFLMKFKFSGDSTYAINKQHFQTSSGENLYKTAA
jgi:hypothetical protein